MGMLYMDQPIDFLSKMKPATGIGLYFNICCEAGLEDDDSTESLFERGMRAAARAILTYISIPFFASLSIFYNGGLGFSKGLIAGVSLICGCIFKIDQEKEMMNDALRHLASAATDLFFLKCSFLLAVGYAALPEQISGFYQRFEEIIHTIDLFDTVSPVSADKNSWSNF